MSTQEQTTEDIYAFDLDEGENTETSSNDSAASETVVVTPGSIWDDIGDLAEDPGTDSGVTALVNKFSNLAICCGVKTQEFSNQRAFAQLVVAACEFASSDAGELSRATAALAQMAKVIARARSVPTVQEVLEAAKSPSHLLLQAAKFKPAMTFQRIYFGNLLPYCRTLPGMALSADHGALRIDVGEHSIKGEVMSYGAIKWSPQPDKFIAAVSRGGAIYSTTGDVFTDYVLMMYSMHHRIDKTGNPDGTVKLEVNNRVTNPKVKALPPIPESVSKALIIVQKFFGALHNIAKTAHMATWTGDATPHIIAAFGQKAIIPSEKQQILQKHLVTFSSYVASLELNVPFTVRDALTNQVALKTVARSEGKPDNVLPILETCRGYRGSKDDIANTTLKDGLLPYWWCGRSVSTTIKWNTVIEDLKKSPHRMVSAIGCASARDKWSSSLDKFAAVRKFDLRAKTTVTEMDIFSAETVLPECDIVLSDVYVDPPQTAPKGSSLVALSCNAQERVLPRILDLAHKAGASIVAVKMFPLAKEKVMHLDHLTAMLEKWHIEYPFLTVYEGGRKHNLEFIVVFSTASVSKGSVDVSKARERIPNFEVVTNRLMNFLAAISAQANLARNARLMLGTAISKLPPLPLIEVLPISPAVVSRHTQDTFDMTTAFDIADDQVVELEDTSSDEPEPPTANEDPSSSSSSSSFLIAETPKTSSALTREAAQEREKRSREKQNVSKAKK